MLGHFKLNEIWILCLSCFTNDINDTSILFFSWPWIGKRFSCTHVGTCSGSGYIKPFPTFLWFALSKITQVISQILPQAWYTNWHTWQFGGRQSVVRISSLPRNIVLEYQIYDTSKNLITPGTVFFNNLYHDIFQVQAESERMSNALKGNKDTNAADYSQHSMSSQFSQLGNNNALLNASIGGMNSSGILFNNNAMNPGVLPHVSTQSSISQVSTFLPHRPGIK